MNNLLKTQAKLQKQAFNVVDKLNLKDILGHYGDFELAGSIKYDLMTWRDIDANLIFDEDPSDNEFWEIVKRLFALPRVKLLTIADNRDQSEENRPRSMYIGIRQKDEEGEEWKIDLRLIARDQVTTDKITKLINEKVPQGSRGKLHFIEDDLGTVFAEKIGIADRVKPSSSTVRFLRITII